MSDYELYGDYNSYDGEGDNGPAPRRGWIWFVRILRVAAVCILVGVCLILAFRIILSQYYPKGMKRLYYTDALKAYAATTELYAETQDIRVPFETEVLVAEEGGTAQAGKSQNGYYYADNLILVRAAGVLQCSVRLNKHAIEEISAAYGLTDYAFGDDAFYFTLTDNLGRTYTPTYVGTDSAALYHYIKVCFDGVAFEDASWMRLEITPRGVDTSAEGYLQLAVCVYENNESYARFEEYSLSRAERQQQ